MVCISVSTGIFSNIGHCHHYSAQSSYLTCAEYNALIIETKRERSFSLVDTLSILDKKKFLETGNILQQTELKSAPSYPTSESTAVNYFHRQNRCSALIRNSTFEKGLTWHKFQLNGLQAVIKLLFSFL